MYLFSRTRRFKVEHAEEALAFCVDITGTVSKLTGTEVRAWSTVYGAPHGTVSWSARVDSQAAMGEMQTKLLSDKGYMSKASEAAGLFTDDGEDMILQFVAFSGEGTGAGDYASLVSAQCAPGKIASAMAWGVDVMHHVAKVTGRDMSMVRSMYGPWASLGWITLADTLEQVDEATDALAADESYVERLDEGGSLFQAHSAQQRLLRRLA